MRLWASATAMQCVYTGAEKANFSTTWSERGMEDYVQELVAMGFSEKKKQKQT